MSAATTTAAAGKPDRRRSSRGCGRRPAAFFASAPLRESSGLEDDAPPAYLGLMSIARLDSRALIRVSGPDARPFLHNLLTQDVETLQPGELRFGALLSPPGRLLFDLFIWGEEDGVVLDVAAERRDALVQRLSLYKLRAQVEVMPIPDAVFVAWGADVPEGFVADPRLPGLGGRRWGDQSETDAVEADWQAHRLALSVPDPTEDALMDKTYPIEANFDLLNGVDFKKGCFIGQVIIHVIQDTAAVCTRLLILKSQIHICEIQISGHSNENGQRGDDYLIFLHDLFHFYSPHFIFIILILLASI